MMMAVVGRVSKGKMKEKMEATSVAAIMPRPYEPACLCPLPSCLREIPGAACLLNPTGTRREAEIN